MCVCVWCVCVCVLVSWAGQPPHREGRVWSTEYTATVLLHWILHSNWRKVFQSCDTLPPQLRLLQCQRRNVHWKWQGVSKLERRAGTSFVWVYERERGFSCSASWIDYGNVCLLVFFNGSKDYKTALSWLCHYSLLSWKTRLPHLKSKWLTFAVCMDTATWPSRCCTN